MDADRRLTLDTIYILSPLHIMKTSSTRTLKIVRAKQKCCFLNYENTPNNLLHILFKTFSIKNFSYKLINRMIESR